VATVNVELARLRRGLRLAWQAGRLERQPVIPVLPGANVRRGFVEPDDFAAILAGIPERYRPVLWFLRFTGWRLSEALSLEWRNVDREAREIRLDTSKTGEPRCVPYGSHPDLSRLMSVLWEGHPRLNPWVFPGRGGRRVSKDCLERHWKNAREAVGLPGVLIHDLRRSWVRDAERAGVPRSVAMSITGHKSERVYQRYAISSVRDQGEALATMSQLPPRGKVARMRKRA
jgi:integrase